MCDLQLMVNSNGDHITYHFRDILQIMVIKKLPFFATIFWL